MILFLLSFPFRVPRESVLGSSKERRVHWGWVIENASNKMSQLADKSEEKPSRLVSLKILVFLFFGGEFRSEISSGLVVKLVNLMGMIRKFHLTWDLLSTFINPLKPRVTYLIDNPIANPEWVFLQSKINFSFLL